MKKLIDVIKKFATKSLDVLTAAVVAAIMLVALVMWATEPDELGSEVGNIWLVNSDCDDHNPSIHPGAVEICDGLDNDCNGIVDDGCVAAK